MHWKGGSGTDGVGSDKGEWKSPNYFWTTQGCTPNFLRLFYGVCPNCVLSDNIPVLFLSVQVPELFLVFFCCLGKLPEFFQAFSDTPPLVQQVGDRSCCPLLDQVFVRHERYSTTKFSEPVYLPKPPQHLMQLNFSSTICNASTDKRDAQRAMVTYTHQRIEISFCIIPSHNF